MDRLTELLDEYGWASNDVSRRAELIRWMTETTNRILEIEEKLKHIPTGQIIHGDAED